MKKKRILAMILAVASCLSLAVSASAANTVARKATDFRDFDKSAWYAEAVSAAVDNGLLYGKSSTIIDPSGDMTRAEMAAIINRSFGCYKTADISQYSDVSKSKWYYKDVALAVQMGTYNGRSASSMAPDAPISRQEAMTVVARALELDYDSYSKTDLSVFSDRSEISNWALPYVRAMVGADYIHGRGKVLAPLDNITRAEFAQIFANIIGTYIVSKGTYDKDIKGSVLIRTDDVELKNLTVDGDLIIGCGAADGKITLDNVTVKGRLLVWGGGTKAVYCNNGAQMPEVVVARVDDAVKVIYDRDSTLAVIDTIKVRITERAKQHKETEVIFYDVSGLREAQKQLNAIVADNQIALTAPAHLYALVGESSVKAEFRNNSKGDTYKVEIRRNKDNALIADAFELAAGKSISSLTLLEAPEFGNVDCTVTITAFRDGKQIGSMQTELVLHTAYQEAEISEDDRWRIFLDWLEGQELTTPSKLTARNFYFEDSIEAMDDRILNFYVVPCFNVDEVFGTFVETDENDHALNIYANYDMQRQQVCDELEITLYGSGIEDQSLTYHLNTAEKEVLREKMEAYCMQREHKPLEQLCQELLQEQDAPTQEMQM